MINKSNSIGIAIILIVFISCKPTSKPPNIVKEPTEWNHTWIVHTDKDNLPKVLIIGDSHAERYYPKISIELEGIAYCSKHTTSQSLGDPFLLREVELLLSQFHFDVITFNNGLHGKGYTEKEYEKSISEMIQLLEYHKNTSIIWVNTTPVRNKNDLHNINDFTKRVDVRNDMVKKYTDKNNIPLVDFYSIGILHPEFYTNDGVHFNGKGVQAEAKMLSDKIKEVLISIN